MDFKTIAFLFMLGLLISCASSGDKTDDKEFVAPDHYGRSK